MLDSWIKLLEELDCWRKLHGLGSSLVPIFEFLHLAASSILVKNASVDGTVFRANTTLTLAAGLKIDIIQMHLLFNIRNLTSYLSGLSRLS